jgi:hypothetical protein
VGGAKERRTNQLNRYKQFWIILQKQLPVRTVVGVRGGRV